MKLPNTYNHNNNRGFTLIEIIVVIGIFSVLAGAGLVFSYDSYRGYLFRSEYGNIAHVITKARNLSANNFHESPHGVHFDTDTYTLFVGDSYASRDSALDIPFERNTAVHLDGPEDVVFEQLSGNLADCSDTPCTLSFSFGSYDKDITISEIGAISW